MVHHLSAFDVLSKQAFPAALGVNRWTVPVPLSTVVTKTGYVPPIMFGTSTVLSYFSSPSTSCVRREVIVSEGSVCQHVVTPPSLVV